MNEMIEPKESRRFLCKGCRRWYEAFAKISRKCVDCNTSHQQPSYKNVKVICEKCGHNQTVRKYYFKQKWICSVCLNYNTKRGKEKCQ